jgi:hypothetical protein
MCTVSWHYEDGGYQLLCNRDERHTRKPASAPIIQQRRGVRFIAPRDGDGGGSWIAVNQFRLTLCLLNRYQDGQAEMSGLRTSRGLLLAQLVDGETPAQVQGRLGGCDLSRFRPFTLAALAGERKPLFVEWTGRECLIDSDGQAEIPLTSSSFDTVRVIQARKRHFEELVAASSRIEPSLLYRFHTSHAPARGAYSPCMHRDDACTVSFSWIKVTEEAIKFFYYPASPCSAPLDDLISISNNEDPESLGPALRKATIVELRKDQ